ncbi:MAG: zinc ribbon domain-containing protein [bacterium]
MPIYEYSCEGCGEDFEAIQKFSDPPLEVCDCGKAEKVTRKVSLSAFHLQGGGWYKDRYGVKSKEKDSNGKKAEAGTKEKKDAKGKEGGASKKGGDTGTSGASTDKKGSSSSPAAT